MICTRLVSKDYFLPYDGLSCFMKYIKDYLEIAKEIANLWSKRGKDTIGTGLVSNYWEAFQKNLLKDKK